MFSFLDFFKNVFKVHPLSDLGVSVFCVLVS